jgi:predicted HAD superfamily Cof-like phosphohydrolase
MQNVYTRVYSNFADVDEFHDKFGLNAGADVPRTLDPSLYEFRMKFLMQELSEIADAHALNDLTKFIDGLIDLVYVAMGTARFAGVSPALWEQLWSVVHQANLCKRRARSAIESKELTDRGHVFDVVKPAGWTSPDPFLKMLIEDAIQSKGGER